MFIEMERLKATYDARREHAERDPAFASVAIRAEVILLSNVHSQAEAHGFKFDSDELPEAGGSGAGPIPLDYFLAGFGFCFLSIMARTAASLGVELGAASFSVRGLLDRRGAYGTPDVYSGFKDISYELSLESTEPIDRIWELVHEVERRCPAHATLEKATTVTQRVLLNGARIEDGALSTRRRERVNNLEDGSSRIAPKQDQGQADNGEVSDRRAGRDHSRERHIR